MPVLSKHWEIRLKDSPDMMDRIRQFGMHGMNEVLAKVLIGRGFDDPDKAKAFLYAQQYASSALMKGTQLAVRRIAEAIQKKHPIVVYGDFDADGVTSTVLMLETLRALFRRQHPTADEAEVIGRIQPYIPNRVDEGYGLNSPALEKLAQAKIKLVVTVDCGIRSVEEVKTGSRAGLDIIVTDHHSIGPDIPTAHAVLNPKQTDCPYPEKMLAGVGVAYRLAEALVKEDLRKHQSKLPPAIDLESLLDLVAIGTVADLAPLNSMENRALVRRGLKVIREANRPGIKALLQVAGIEPKTATAMTIGFALGPRINAAGRLKDAMLACELLYTRDEARAQALAQTLQDLNTERQKLTREAQEKIKASVEAIHDQPLIFAGDSSFKPGIVGLVAGRLVEEYFRPAVVLEYGDEESRASCRSIPHFDITHALDQCADLLVRHGGHAQAAGFTVANKNIEALRDHLMQLAHQSLSEQDLKPILEIDADVNVNQLNENLLKDLEQLEPTGHMNPSPVFMSRSVCVKDKRTVGADGKHLKLKLSRAGLPPLDAIGFSLGAWASQLPEYVDIAYQLEMNEWNGNRSLQLNVLDIKAAEAASGR